METKSPPVLLVLLAALTAILLLIYGASTVELVSRPPVVVAPVSKALVVDVRGPVRLIVNTTGGNGSVVVLKPGVVLTAKHVSGSGGDLYIEPEHIKATLIRESLKSDLAILSAPGIGCPCAAVASFGPKVDDTVVVVGFPLNPMVQVQVLTEGKIHGVTERGYVTTASATFGNSGGGVFFGGKLVGILSSLPMQGDGMFGGVPHNGITFAVDHRTIVDFLGKQFS